MNKYIKYALYALALIPAFIFRDYTPSNELRYISIVDEALRDGSIFCFFNHGEAYADKPPLYLWLLMALRVILGSHQMWAISLLSILPSVGIIAVMDKWCSKYAGLNKTTAVSSALITTVMYIGSTMVLRMDILMILFILLSLYKFYKLYQGDGTTLDKWLIPLFIFLAVFTKGPMGIIIPFLSITTFLIIKKDIRNFGKYFCYKQLIFMLALFFTWFGLIYIEGGSDYLNNILFNQTINRGIDSFHHKEPIYYYVQNILYTMAPWSLFYLTVFIISIKKKLFQTDIEKFFASIIVSSFIILSIISSKIDIYMVPIYPFIVYLAFILFRKQEVNNWHKAVIIIPCIVFAATFPASFFANMFLPFPIESLLLPHIALFVLTSGAIYGIYLTCKNQIEKAINYVSISFLITIFIASPFLLQINDYLGFKNLAGRLTEISKENPIERIDYYKFRGIDNLDVFMKKVENKRHFEVEELRELENIDILLIRKKDITKDEDLKEFLNRFSAKDSIGDIVIYR